MSFYSQSYTLRFNLFSLESFKVMSNGWGASDIEKTFNKPNFQQKSTLSIRTFENLEI